MRIKASAVAATPGDRLVHPKLAVIPGLNLPELHRFLAQLAPHPLGLPKCTGLIASGKNDEKFLAAIASNRIVRPSTGLHPASGFAKHRITGEVSVRIVHAP